MFVIDLPNENSNFFRRKFSSEKNRWYNQRKNYLISYIQWGKKIDFLN